MHKTILRRRLVANFVIKLNSTKLNLIIYSSHRFCIKFYKFEKFEFPYAVLYLPIE